MVCNLEFVCIARTVRALDGYRPLVAGDFVRAWNLTFNDKPPGASVREHVPVQLRSSGSSTAIAILYGRIV